MPKYLLNKQEQELAVVLAENMLKDNNCLSVVYEQFLKYNFSANAVMDFWKNYNEMTKAALNKLIAYRCRKHLEICLNLDCAGHPELEN